MAEDGRGNHQPIFTSPEIMMQSEIAALGGPPVPRFQPQQHITNHHQQQQQQHQHQHQQQSAALPPLRSPIRFHSSERHVGAQQQQQQQRPGAGGGVGVIQGSPLMRQTQQILSHPISQQQQQQRSDPSNGSSTASGGIGRSVPGSVGSVGYLGSRTVSQAIAPFPTGGVNGTLSGGRGTVVSAGVDIPLTSSQCRLPQAASWSPALSLSFLTGLPHKDGVASPSGAWRHPQPFGKGSNAPVSSGTINSMSSGDWTQQARAGGLSQVVSEPIPAASQQLLQQLQQEQLQRLQQQQQQQLQLQKQRKQQLKIKQQQKQQQQQQQQQLQQQLQQQQLQQQQLQHQQLQQQQLQQQQLQHQQLQQQQKQWTVETITKALVKSVTGKRGDPWPGRVDVPQVSRPMSDLTSPDGSMQPRFQQALAPVSSSGGSSSSIPKHGSKEGGSGAQGVVANGGNSSSSRNSNGRNGVGGAKPVDRSSEACRAGKVKKELRPRPDSPGAAVAATAAAIAAALSEESARGSSEGARSRSWDALRTTIPLVQSALKRQRQLEPALASAPADPPAPVPKKPVPVAPKASKRIKRPAPPPPPPPSVAAATSCGKPGSAGAGSSPWLTGSSGAGTGGKVDRGKGGEAGSIVRGDGVNGADADLGTGRLIRKKTPTKFLSSLHSMLISGNSQIWWERETGSVVIEHPQFFESETMPRYFPDPKLSAFYRQLAFYGFRKAGKNAKQQGRFVHPDCRWKDVSCVKNLMTKKVLDQKRLQNALRNTASGSQDNGTASPSCASPGEGGGSSSGGGINIRDVKRKGKGAAEKVEEDAGEVERTELEIATEAAVVRPRGVGQEARKELRLSMTREQMGCRQLEQMAKLMMEVMRLNAKLLKGLKECRARGGPPRVRRCQVKSPELMKLRKERAKLRRRVRQLEDEVEARGMTLTPP